MVKYRLRIAATLATDMTTKKEIEKLHGCLNYVAAVEPFGRPFLAHLTDAITDVHDEERIVLSPLARMSLKIWDVLLKKNRGISYNFALDKLPLAQSNIFVDASTEWGIGGCCGEYYFQMPWCQLREVRHEIIARKELLAALIAIFCFGDVIAGKLVKL